MDPFFIIIIGLLLFFWLMTSRTRKQQRAAAQFRDELEVGTEVITAGGYIGTIVDIEGDVITLESAPGAETRWLRAAIQRVAPEPVEEEPEGEFDELEGTEVPDDASELVEDAGEDDTPVATDTDDDGAAPDSR